MMQLFYYINEMEINYNKRNIMENNLLPKIRELLSSSADMDDSQALSFIADMVFDDPDAARFSGEELAGITRKLFFKTRKKLGVITPLMEDETISEIMVNGPEDIFYEKDGKIRRFELNFDSAEELEEVIRKIAARVHREFNELNPIVDARLGDGSRVNGVYKNVAINGPILTIRKFSDSYMDLSDLADNGTLTEEAAGLLRKLVRCRYNLFVSGGTSSGKTTLLNALSRFIGKDERVIVIEDSAELQLNCIDNLVRMECRYSNGAGRGAVDMSRLIKASLRMRPDRIIVGEVRGGEVLDMLQAMNTGHAGSMSTGHGNSIIGMLKRLETMYLMATPLSIDAIRSQIAQAIEIMIHTERTERGRKVVEITELSGYESGEFKLNVLMESDGTGMLMPTGRKIINRKKLDTVDRTK